MEAAFLESHLPACERSLRHIHTLLIYAKIKNMGRINQKVNKSVIYGGGRSIKKGKEEGNLRDRDQMTLLICIPFI